MCNISLIDTHCDTALELFRRGEGIISNSCDISLENAAKFKNYAQFFAVWSDKRLTNSECFDNFICVCDYMDKEIKKHADKIQKVIDKKELDAAWKSNRCAAFYAVEDARLLDGDLSRLTALKARGVKYLTLTWSGESCIGGSHDTNISLTDFGRDVVRACFESGIIPDVSHASRKTLEDVLNIAQSYKLPIIASHSNSFLVCPHSRNLDDEHFKEIIKLGGIVGISLCPYHLSASGDADVHDIIAHIEHYISLGGIDNIGLGCDLDGTSLPRGFRSVADLIKISDTMTVHGFSEEIRDRIFWKNHYKFIKANM